MAHELNIPHITLRRYCVKHKETIEQRPVYPEISLERYGYYNNRYVFNTEHESMLLKAATLYYGLCTDEVRSLAYEYA